MSRREDVLVWLAAGTPMIFGVAFVLSPESWQRNVLWFWACLAGMIVVDVLLLIIGSHGSTTPEKEEANGTEAGGWR